MALTLSAVPGIPMIQPGDSLADLLYQALQSGGFQLQNNDILVIAQKIVSKAEGRLVNLTQVTPSERALKLAQCTEKDPRFVELVLQESSEVLRFRTGALIVEHKKGFVCANAGIDHSNVAGSWGSPEDWVLLLPEDADASAEKIRLSIEQLAGVHVGVIIIDSHGRAWRNGTVGITIGLSNVPGIVDMRGKPDLFGYRLRITMIAAADELAAAASLVMGQADESTPLVHVRGFPYPLRGAHLQELIRSRDQDMFR
jgi:coenzyme F420-0:L-glutamate ligase / coenzyme F420-1:gamma-L-glutamate ligase